jgi:tetratricopeptide (TPR) repeat protein
MQQHASRSFIGRERELGALDAALQDALAGHGSLVLLVGEAGIGKTRLADELTLRAEASGMASVWGRCWEAEGRPPHWPWVQILRALRASQSGAGGEFAPESDLPYLAQILPELGAATPPARGLDAEAARFRLFDATTACLTNAARARPLLVIVDDVHCADVASLRLLQFFAHALAGVPLLALATYREVEARQEPAVAEVLNALGRMGRHLPLRGLSAPEVRRFAELTAGRPLPAAVTERIHRHTEGNPFFVDEVVRALLASDADPEHWPLAASAAFPISHGVRGAIRQRLAPLAPTCRSILAAAAVIGREFELTLLADACEATPEAVIAQLAPPLERALLVRPPGSAGRYRFAHALVRDTLYEELPPDQRVLWHGRLARILEERSVDGIDARLSELAHHFFEAASLGEEEKAVEYAERAGHEAMAMLAYEEAAEHYGRALQVLQCSRTADPRRQGELLLALGEARNRAGQGSEAAVALRHAAALARRLGAGELLARAAIGLCGGAGLIWTEFGRTDETVIRLLEEARAAVAGSDSALSARVTTRLATELCWAPDAARADALSRAAVDSARRAADPATLAYALLGRMLCASGPDDIEERRAAVDEVLALTEPSGDRDVAVNALMWRIGDALQLGDVAGLRAGTAALVRMVRELNQPADLWMVPTVEAQRALLDGRFADAERLAEAIVAEPTHRANAAQVGSALLFLVRREQGRIAELEAGLKSLVYQYPNVTVWRASLAWLYSESGRDADAQAEVEQLAGADCSAIPRDLTWQYTVSCLASVYAQSGSPAQVGMMRAALTPFAGRNVVAGPFFYLGPVDYYLGLLAIRAGCPDEALAHLDAALRQCAAMGAQPDLARILVAQARLHAEQGAADAARRLLDEAAAIAQPRGMDALARRIDALRRDLDGGGVPSHRRTAASNASAALRCEGDYWTIAHAGHLARVRDAKGLHYLRVLLRDPGREFHVLDLVCALHDGAPDTGFGGAAPRESGAAVLDEKAKRAYRVALQALRSEIDDAERTNDLARAAAAREQIDGIAEQLAAAVGLGGRDRRMHSESERARASVTKAIRTAIRLIGERHAALAALLDAAVHTGTFCSYVPRDRPVTWDL